MNDVRTRSTGSRSRRWLFALGLAIPLLTGGNVFLFLTPETGALCFDFVAITCFAFLAGRDRGQSPRSETTRLALVSLLALGLWWGSILVLRPSGPRAPLEAQGIFAGILLFAVLSGSAPQAVAVWSFVRGLVIGTLVTAAYGQYQYWIAFPRSAPLLASRGIPVVEIVNANFYNANCYGAFLSAVIVLGAALSVLDWGAPRGLLVAVGTILLAATLLFSESRSAIALFAIAIVGWLAPTPRRGSTPRERRALPMVLLLAAAALAGAAASVNFRELWSVGLLGRIAIWQGSLAMIRDHWRLGVGLGRFWDYFPVYRVNTYYTRYPHSFLLEVFAELGIVGLIALLGFLGSAAIGPLRVFVSVRTNPTARFEQSVELALVVGSSLLILHGLVDIDWHAPANPILLFALLGMAQQFPHEPSAPMDGAESA